MKSKRRLEPGGQLGRYELLTPIAQGGMASVWAARQTGSHGFRKTVAVKTILPTLSDDPQFERMFLTEAKLTMRIHHPNVAETLDLGEDDGLLYLVMEWVDGESLSTLSKAAETEGQRLPLRLALHICARACRGLHAAHDVADDDDRPVGIVHRDVSPQNIMVTYDGHVKVLDFGVAKGLLDGAATQIGQFKGKVPYMAPEQASGARVDRRTDVFAMGTLLYRVTLGRHPFMGESAGLTVNNVVWHEPTPPSQRDATYPRALETIVTRCLVKDPDGRYPTISEVADQLEAVIASLGPAVSEQELGTFVKLHLGERRKRRREAMRDAARALGWAVSTGDSMPRAPVSDPGLSLTPSTTAGGGSVGAVVGSGSLSLPARPRRSVWAIRAALAGIVAGAAVAGIWVVRTLPTPVPAPTLAAPTQEQTPLATPTSPPPEPPVSGPAPPPSGAASASTGRLKTGAPAGRPSPTGKPSARGPDGKWQNGPDMGF